MEATMLNRRKTQRYPAYLGGRIVFDRQFATIDCLVRNVTEAGARLVFDNTTFVPKTFDLTIPRRNMTYPVHARWRRFGEMGVEIEPRPAASATVIPIALARRLRKLQRDHAALQQISLD
jgi:hypothetical protein